MDGHDWAVLAAIGTSVSAIVAVLGLRNGNAERSTKIHERLTKVETVADNAMQESAEAKNDNDNLREEMGALRRDHSEVIERRSREHGDGLSAIRQHVTELAFFVRDNFVKRDDFAAAMKDIKDSQTRMEKMIADVRDRLPRRHSLPPGSD